MNGLKNNRAKRLNPDLIFVAVLFLYPMRHINWGLDFWDTGYNYANFTYMGLEHMDPMWLFSTYLSNAAGHFLTLLPGAGTLLGMNFYTGLFAAGLALGGYFFCTAKLEIPGWIAFTGEMAALSLCWCPTAKLYDYLTYVFFLACVIFLYIGLTEDRRWLLFAAGVCLGCNVLVRFSNLPEAAMIAAVWAWDIILRREDGTVRGGTGRWGEPAGRAQNTGVHIWKQVLFHTFWCMGGYLAALAVLLGFIQIRYGLSDYAAGIRQLLAMTDHAADYKASSMLMGMIRIYVTDLYWVVRIAAVILAGTAFFAVLGLMRHSIGAKSGRDGSGGLWRAVLPAARIGWCGAAVWLLVWMYRNHAFSFQYFSYNSMLKPATLFLMLTMLAGGVRILHPACSKEEKLISGMVILVVLLTSIGSNNGVYPSINNLFAAGPYTLWQCWRFIRYAGNWSPWEGRSRRGAEAGRAEQECAGRGITVSPFPAKAVLTAFLVLFLFQSAAFGACFVFAEGTGVVNITGVVENNKVLKGIRMNPERARWMSEISAYAQERGLQGREVVLFGQLPALSYYLQMPSAFNPWSDLRSYSYETMQLAVRELSEEIEEKGKERPVLIFDRNYVRQYEWYQEGGEELLREHGLIENQVLWITGTNRKFELLQDFAEKYNYDLTFENEKFMIYE